MFFHSLEATLAQFGADAYEWSWLADAREETPFCEEMSSNVSRMFLVGYDMGLQKNMIPVFLRIF